MNKLLETEHILHLDDYDARSIEKEAYAQYYAFKEERKKRQERERIEEATKHRGLIGRWLHNKLHAIRERWDDEEELELLFDANPRAWYAYYKQNKESKK